MRIACQYAALAMFAAVVAIAITGCGAKKVAGKTYVTSVGDTIEFHADGTAKERNAHVTWYNGQTVVFGEDGSYGGTGCTYAQKWSKITLTCDPGTIAVFTVIGDGSLAGPAAGMWGQTAFAHLTEAK